MAAAAGETEWLTIVEIQQQELEELRARIAEATVSPVLLQHLQHELLNDEATRPDSAGSVQSAFGIGSKRTYRSSSSASRSGRNSAVDTLPLDLQRFAKVCGEVEALQQRLTRKDITNRELRAKTSQMARDIEQYRQEQSESERRMQLLITQLANEQSAKQEAIERVVQAMVQNEELAFKLQEATQMAASLRSELNIRGELTRELERRQSRTQDETTSSRENVARLEGALALVQRELEIRTAELRAEQERREAHVCKSEKDEGLQIRIVELEDILELQTRQLEKQQLAIVDLHRVCKALEDTSHYERSHSQQHAAYQMEANVALQKVLDDNTIQIRALQHSLAESEERAQMQLEETEAYASWRRLAVKRELQRQQGYTDVLNAKQKLEKALRQVDTARRKAIAELVDTKKQLELLRRVMHGIDEELQQMNKAFVAFRAREANVSKALREYGCRNRSLEDAVQIMSSKVHHLSESLRRSEQRKQQAVVASHQLKRGLVVERCQREDLLQQCIELETCLSSFQRAAFQSADRAHSVEKENSVLQQAVTQLCTYAKELAETQHALQSELKQLEVRGCVEPHVFG